MAEFPIHPAGNSTQPVEPLRPLSDEARDKTPRPKPHPKREKRGDESGHQIDEFA